MKLATLALCAVLAFTGLASDHGHGTRPSRPVPRPEEPRRPAPQPPMRPRPARPEHPRPEPRQGRAPRDGERREARRHWDGRRFDRDYWEHHYGYRHPFYFYEAYWLSEPCMVGSTFYMNGTGFIVVEQMPDPWCGAPVYIEEFNGQYVIMNPEYPDVRFGVVVVF